MRNVCILFLLVFTVSVFGQEGEKKVREPLYEVEADAKVQVENAIAQAKEEGKHVFLKIGGNWCKWCYYFHEFIEEDEEIKSLMDTHYITVPINYSKENKNLEVMEMLEFPQRFGFPVFVILDSEGNRLHTQNSAYLESDESYDQKEVSRFLSQWSPGALNPKHYYDR